MLGYGLILGIDPGTQQHNLGISLVDTGGRLVYCDEVPPLLTPWPAQHTSCVGMDKLSDKLVLLEARFANTFHDIRMMHCERILLAGIEDQWVGKNPQGTMTLSKQFGVIFGILAGLGIYAVRIQPKQGKKAITGSGNATKEQVLRMAQQMGYGGDNENAADAAGVALAALEKWKEWEIGKLAV